MQQCHPIQGLGITRLRNLLTNYTGVNLYIITFMKIGEQTIIFLAVNKNGDEIILDNTPARQGEIWTDERSTHDEEYFSIEDHNSAIVLPKGTIRRLTGRDLKWEDDPISLKSKSVIDKFPHADIEFYKQKIINFVEWI